MKTHKRRIQLTVIFCIVLFLLLLFNDEWGTSDKPYTGLSDLPSSTVADSIADLPPQPESQTVSPTPDTVSNIEVPEENTSDSTTQTPTDSLQVLKDTIETLQKEEVETIAELPYNLIEVRRKNDSLLFIINGEETNNLVMGLTQLKPEKETLLKLSGNVTYVEEQEVKTTLDVKEITYKEAKN